MRGNLRKFAAVVLAMGMILPLAAQGVRGTNPNPTSGFTTTGAVKPATDNTTDSGAVAARWRNVYTGRIITGAATPTAAVTGAGTTATAILSTGSTDLGGQIVISATGTGQAAAGTTTLTYSTTNGAYGTNNPACVAMLSSQSGVWNARATIMSGAPTTTSIVFLWDNNAVALTASSTYVVNYQCIGK